MENKVSIQCDRCMEPCKKTCMKKVSIQCERCFDPYKKICPKELTCIGDLKVGLCQPCKTDVALDLAKYVDRPEYILRGIERFRPKWMDKEIKEYHTICDAIPTP